MEGVETMDKKQLIKLLSTFVMGDGGVYYSGHNCRYVRNQLTKHEDFLNFQKNVLEMVTSTTLINVPDIRDNRQPCSRLMTRAHPVFTKLREQIYTGNYKSISPHYLKLMDWEMLAYLYQDDGCISIYTKDNNDYCDITLNLKRLSYGDQLLLKNALKEKLDLEFNVNGRKFYFLRLRFKDQAKFLNGVARYIFPSFEYKLICPDDWLRNADGDIVRTLRRRREVVRNDNSSNIMVQK
jgi:hypothetical protein